MGDLEPDEVREWEGEAVDDEKVLSGLMAATMHTAETKFNPGKKNQKRRQLRHAVHKSNPPTRL